MAFLGRFLRGTSPGSLSTAKEKAQAIIDENPVVLFGKSWCGFCRASQRLLNSAGAEYENLDLDKMEDGRAIQDALYEITGQTTVPNIFINHKHIGGNSELQAVSDLKGLLKEAGALKEAGKM